MGDGGIHLWYAAVNAHKVPQPHSLKLSAGSACCVVLLSRPNVTINFLRMIRTCPPFCQQGDGRTISEMADPANERRPDPVAVQRITPFVRPYVSPDQLPPDYLALSSLTFGVVGLMLKVRYYETTAPKYPLRPTARHSSLVRGRSPM